MSETEVIYNGACPICSREIAAYARAAEAGALPLRFTDLSSCDLARLGLTEEAAARRLHVLRGGELLSGVPAFLALWAEMPRLRWLSRLVGLPGMRHVATLVYEGALAPALYAMHRRRQARAG
jgi:predicted DCC family thiol-disulfide oxidoreductase YuxK